MAHFRRFGRRKPLPSTLAISHDLMALWADEKAREFCAEADGLPGAASWEEIVVRRRALAAAPKRFDADDTRVSANGLNGSVQ